MCWLAGWRKQWTASLSVCQSWCIQLPFFAASETEVVKTLGPIILSSLSSLNYKMLSVACGFSTRRLWRKICFKVNSQTKSLRLPRWPNYMNMIVYMVYLPSLAPVTVKISCTHCNCLFVSGIKGLIPNCWDPQAHLQFQSGHTGWTLVVSLVVGKVISTWIRRVYLVTEITTALTLR